MQGGIGLTGPVTDGRPTRSAEASRRAARAGRRGDPAARSSPRRRRLFTALGYDGAGMREIASAAGVDARLIGRYFGSKEGLFAEVVDASYEKSLMMTPGHEPRGGDARC